MRAIRTAMKAAGLRVESSKARRGPDSTRSTSANAMGAKAADDHVIYKTGAKELAHQCGMSLTFWRARPNVGRLLLSHPLVAVARGDRPLPVRRTPSQHYLAGQIALASELAIFLRRRSTRKALRRGKLGADDSAWGYDTAPAAFRVVGHGKALRADTRIPGADANPYLAFARCFAAGLYGIEQRPRARPPFEGNATSPTSSAPGDAAEANARLENGTAHAGLLATEVVDHT